MKTIEYRTMDKSEWGDGPWRSEVDKRQWLDEASGLPCMIRRSPSSGGWCGYVGVPAGHLLHGVKYDGVDVDVHGGLTFSGACSPGEPEAAICHVVEPGEDDNVWWFGFDCNHAWDYAPMYAKRTGFPRMVDEVYRDQEYVTAETLKLARQLARMPS